MRCVTAQKTEDLHVKVPSQHSPETVLDPEILHHVHKRLLPGAILRPMNTAFYFFINGFNIILQSTVF